MFYKIKSGNPWRWFHWLLFVVINFVLIFLILAGSARIFWHSSLFLDVLAQEAAFLMSSSKKMTVEIEDIRTRGFMNVSFSGIKIKEKSNSQETTPFFIKELDLDYSFNPRTFYFTLRGRLLVNTGRPVFIFFKGPLTQTLSLFLGTSQYAHGYYEGVWAVRLEDASLNYFLKFLLSGFGVPDFFFTQINGNVSGQIFYEDKPPFNLASRKGKASLEISNLRIQDQKILDKIPLEITLDKGEFHHTAKSIAVHLPQTSLNIEGVVLLELRKEKTPAEVQKNPWLLFVHESYLPVVNARVTTEKKNISLLGCDLDVGHVLLLEGPLSDLQCRISDVSTRSDKENSR